MASEVSEVAGATIATDTMALPSSTKGIDSGYKAGRVEYKGSKGKGRHCWITYPKEVQVPVTDVAEIHATHAAPTEVAVATVVTDTMALPSSTEEIDSGSKAGRVEYKGSKGKGRHCWVTYPKEVQAVPVAKVHDAEVDAEFGSAEEPEVDAAEVGAAEIHAAPSEASGATITTDTMALPIKGTDSGYKAGRVEYLGSKGKGRHCWVTYPKEVQVVPVVKVHGIEVDAAEVDDAEVDAAEVDAAEVDAAEVHVAPSYSEVSGATTTTDTMALPIKGTDSGYQTGRVQYMGSKGKGRHCWVTYPKEVQEVPVAEVHTAEAHTAKVHAAEDHAADIHAAPSEVAQSDVEVSPTVDTSLAASNITRASSVTTTSEIPPQSTLIKTPNNAIASHQPGRVVQTRRNCWVTYYKQDQGLQDQSSKEIAGASIIPCPKEVCRSETLPAGCSEKRKLSKKQFKWITSAAHKYFPYLGPVKNRNLHFPRSCPVPEFDHHTVWDVDDGSSPNIPDNTYPAFNECFNKLPCELRIMIINMSLEDRRVTIELQTDMDATDPDAPRFIPQKWVPLIQPPAALFVNKEFREVALKKYGNFFGVYKKTFKALPGELIEDYVRPRAEPRIPFSWRDDTVVIDLPYPEWFLKTVGEFQQRDREHITKLAVRFDVFHDHTCLSQEDIARSGFDPLDFHHAIAMFPRLVQLDLLVPHYINAELHAQGPWKEDNFDRGNMVSRSLMAFRQLCAKEEVNPINPKWVPPFTVRTVQLLADGQPRYTGVEELFLRRKEYAEAKWSMAKIRQWEKDVMKPVKRDPYEADHTFVWPGM